MPGGTAAAVPPPLLSVPMTLGIMLVAYALVMVYLGAGLRALYRQGGARPAAGGRRGWPGLIRRVVGTAVGGYVLLMGVVLGYYYGVAHVAGSFLASAATGCATLVGISLPVFFALSWWEERRRTRRRG